MKVPPGIDDGRALRIAGRGHPSPDVGGPPGDLFVVVASKDDPRFERRGPHLWRAETIEVADAVLGTSRAVPTLDGEASVTIPAGTQPGHVLCLRGEGLPHFGADGRGDLYVVVRVRIPDALGEDERRLYEQLRRLQETYTHHNKDGRAHARTETVTKGERDGTHS